MTAIRILLLGLFLPGWLQAQVKITSLALSPDGRFVAYSQQSTVPGESETRIVDVVQRRVLHRFPCTSPYMQFGEGDGLYLDLCGRRWEWRFDTVVRALSGLEEAYFYNNKKDGFCRLPKLNAFCFAGNGGLLFYTGDGYEVFGVSYYDPALLEYQKTFSYNYAEEPDILKRSSEALRAPWYEEPVLGCDHVRYFLACAVDAEESKVGFLFYPDAFGQTSALGLLHLRERRTQVFSLNAKDADWLQSLRFSPDGSRALVAIGNGWISVDCITGKQIRSATLPGDEGFEDLLYNPQGNRILGLHNKTVYCWDAEGKLLSSASYPNLSDLQTLWFHPDGKHYLAELSEDKKYRLEYYRIEDHKLIERFDGLRLPYHSVSDRILPERGLVGPDGKRFLALTQDRQDWKLIDLKD